MVHNSQPRDISVNKFAVFDFELRASEVPEAGGLLSGFIGVFVMVAAGVLVGTAVGVFSGSGVGVFSGTGVGVSTGS